MVEIELEVLFLRTLEDYIEFYGGKCRGRMEWDKYKRKSMKISDKDIHMVPDPDSLRS